MEAEEVHFRETGDTARLRAYVREAVPAWFVSHIQSMDAVTAGFIAAHR
jgi:hemerythrin